MDSTRRSFLKKTAYVTAGFTGLGRFVATAEDPQAYHNEVDQFGPLVADPARILDLPEGFSYVVLSRTGDFMSDGYRVPGAPDGMAAFAGASGQAIIVRNHELTPDRTFQGPYGVRNELFGRIDRGKLYDAGKGQRPHLGGTTTIVYDLQKQSVVREFLSLVGTSRNCAGGVTPWNSGVTCEETVELKGEFSEADHGYNFEVPVTSEPRLATPVPLKAMGRFNHEAIAVHPKTGIVYQTEDRGDGLIYRFLPNTYGDLAAGGKLQVLGLKDYNPGDTRNWPEIGGKKIPVGQPLDVVWMDIDNVESPSDDLRVRGRALGAVPFACGEGMWYGRDDFYFACTSGGAAKKGQIFRYKPSVYEATEREKEAPGTLELFIEPNDIHLVEYCDNVTVAPWGDLIIAEDGVGKNYLRGITPDGKIYTLANNGYRGQAEFCGVCFAPNHPTLFVNIQTPGITLAVTGPWDQVRRH